MTEMTENVAPEPTGPSRRSLLKGAAVGVGALWVAPVMVSFASPAAAASGTSTVNLQKDQDGTLASRCVLACNEPNSCSNAGRGSVVFVRSENPATIRATINISTGTAVAGRQVYILQSNGSTCLAQSLVGLWAGTNNEQFAVGIVAGATRFAVHMPFSGGGGNDIYTSFQAILP